MSLKFKDYILALDEERCLETTLRRLSYDINQGLPKMVRGRLETLCVNFLSFITIYYADSSCKYAFPLLCLLLERAVWTMGVARSASVSPNEFSLLGVSMKTVEESMRSQAKKLQSQMLTLPGRCPQGSCSTGT